MLKKNRFVCMLRLLVAVTLAGSMLCLTQQLIAAAEGIHEEDA